MAAPATYSLSVGVNRSVGTYGLSADWAKQYQNHSIGANGYWVIILNRTDPGATPLLEHFYSDPPTMLQAINNTVNSNQGNCILIVLGLTGGAGNLDNWGWDLGFIEAFGEYGARDVYFSLVQNMLLLTGSAPVVQNAMYCLVNIPGDSLPGYEAGAIVGDDQGSAVVTMAFELFPINLPSGVKYSLRLID